MYARMYSRRILVRVTWFHLNMYVAGILIEAEPLLARHELCVRANGACHEAPQPSP